MDVLSGTFYCGVQAKLKAREFNEMTRKAEGFGIQKLLNWDNENGIEAQEIIEKYEQSPGLAIIC